jgi:uncharacterized protein with HEPN domain
MKPSIESDLFRLKHIQDCIEKITILVHSCKTVAVFKSRWIEQDAMIRNFEIIGEASNHISDEIKKNYPNTEWYKMRGMKNFMSHEYFGVRPETIWDTAVENIPILKLQIAEIITAIEVK